MGLTGAFFKRASSAYDGIKGVPKGVSKSWIKRI